MSAAGSAASSAAPWRAKRRAPAPSPRPRARTRPARWKSPSSRIPTISRRRNSGSARSRRPTVASGDQEQRRQRISTRSDFQCHTRRWMNVHTASNRGGVVDEQRVADSWRQRTVSVFGRCAARFAAWPGRLRPHHVEHRPIGGVGWPPSNSCAAPDSAAGRRRLPAACAGRLVRRSRNSAAAGWCGTCRRRTQYIRVARPGGMGCAGAGGAGGLGASGAAGSRPRNCP